LIAMGFPCTLSSSYDGSELTVDAFRFVRITSAIGNDHRLHAGPDHMRVHADAADPAELEERVDEVIVAGIEVEI